MIKICAVERRMIDKCPLPAGVKDEYSRYVYVNQYYADIVGIKETKDVIGLTVNDLPTTSSRCASEFNEQDLHVMQTGKHLPAYCVYKIDGDDNARVYRYIKYPFKDSSDKIKGVWFLSEDFTNKTFINIGAIITSKGKKNATDSMNKVDALNKKLKNVLFYVCLGKSAKEISSTMHVSERTVESYIEQLKYELDVHYKTGISAFGTSSSIPDSILHDDVSIVIDDNF